MPDAIERQAPLYDILSLMIQHLLLDLDNTLYPASGRMDEGITRRMIDFVAQHLAVSPEEATRLRIKRLPVYSTTLEWLKVEHGLRDEEAYFHAVHPESEVEELQKDDQLRPYLQSLDLPMTLLTNSPVFHAERLLEFFNISDLFLGVFDITWHKGQGKPHPDAFRNTLEAVGYTVDQTLFVDDHLKYVRGYRAIGGQAALVDENGEHRAIASAEGYWYMQNIYGLKDLLTADGASRHQKNT